MKKHWSHLSQNKEKSYTKTWGFDNQSLNKPNIRNLRKVF